MRRGIYYLFSHLYLEIFIKGEREWREEGYRDSLSSQEIR
jgi:hypothetical protein